GIGFIITWGRSMAASRLVKPARAMSGDRRSFPSRPSFVHRHAGISCVAAGKLPLKNRFFRSSVMSSLMPLPRAGQPESDAADPARRELEAILDGMSTDDTVLVVRAFSYFSHLANIAED